MSNKSAILIPSRKGSSRLKSKATLLIKNKPMIEHLIDRMKSCQLADMIVLCTTTKSEDDELVEIAERNQIQYFRGSEEDILSRYLGAMDEYNIDFCANVDGDDLFCSIDYVDKTLDFLSSTKIDFLEWHGLPYGAAPIGFTKKSMKYVCNLKSVEDTQTNWGRFFTLNNNIKSEILECTDKSYHLPISRMTIDYTEDFEFAKRIFEELYSDESIFTLKDIVKLLKNKPEILDINFHMQTKYKANLINVQSEVKFND